MKQVWNSHHRLRAAVLAASCVGGLALSCGFASAETLVVMTDRAKIIKLPQKTKTVIIGNPFIADVTLDKSGLVVLTGKAYGTTNMISLDGDGSVLNESTIQVQQPTENVVVVQRGMARDSMSCTPNCSPTVALGDDKEYFDGVSGQSQARNKLATDK